MDMRPTRVVDPETVLALLEDGPHATTELATWCETTTKAMTTRLAQLAAAGRVRRLSSGPHIGRWTRGMATRRPEADPAIVLQQLQFAPKAETALADACGVSIAALRLTLARLAEQGQVKPIGKPGALRWALARWTADLPQSARPQKTNTPADPGVRAAQGSTSGALPLNEFTALKMSDAGVPDPGSRSRYQAGCRCLPCRAANACYMAQLRGRQARGLPTLGQLISPTDAARRVRQLKREGYTETRIAQMAGWRDRHLQFIGRTRIRLRTYLRIRRVAQFAMLEGHDVPPLPNDATA